jgi:type IV pilus assembly protein PilA
MIHLRSSERNRQRGFTLMELLIVMSIMIILMLIAIPNFISMKAQADETSAIQSLRAIYQAQIQYQTSFPPTASPARCLHSAATRAPVHPAPRRRRCCREIWPRDRNRATRSTSSTAPRSRSTTRTCTPPMRRPRFRSRLGSRAIKGFCIDQAGEIKADLAGGTNCTPAIQ